MTNPPVIDPTVWIDPEDPKAKTSVPVVAALRVKLLEGLNRGSLVNLRHDPRSRSHVRIVDTDFDNAFRVLSGQTNGASEFTPIAEPPDEPADERSERFTFAYSAARRISSDIERLTDSLDPDDESDQRTMARAERKLKDEVRESLGMAARLQKGVQTEAQVARSQGINPGFELDSKPLSDTATRTTLQTLQYPREMSAKLNAIRTGARRAMEESGSVALHAAFGFLEWSPAGGRDRTIMSPIILTPIEFSSSVWQSRRQYVVYPQGDEPAMNPALQVRLNDENIVLPEWDGTEGPADYLKKVDTAIAKKAGWKVHRYLTIGLFESAVINVWQDLDPERWPGRTDPSLHNVVADLLAGSGGRIGDSSEEYEIDKPEIAQRLPEPILDADSSQLSAMIDVLDGKNLAIQGPPGTGKSQTIANIIAAAMGKGKSVLFVAEKMAALDVVKKRLDDVGLGDFVLELHSTKVSRSSVYQSFESRLELARKLRAPADYEQRLAELRRVKGTLNEYVETINKPLGAIGKTVHYAMWRIRSLSKQEIPASLSAHSIEHSPNIDHVELSSTLDALSAYQNLHQEVTGEFENIYSHPWRFVSAEISPIDQESLIQHVSDQLDASLKVRSDLVDLSWIRPSQNTESQISVLQLLVDELLQLPNQCPEGVSAPLLQALGFDLSSLKLVEVIETSKELATITGDVRQLIPSTSEPPDPEVVLNIGTGLDEANINSVGQLPAKSEELEEQFCKLTTISESVTRILREMGIEFDLTGENIRLVERVVIASQIVTPSGLRIRSNAYVDDLTFEAIDSASSTSESQKKSLSRLSKSSIWKRDESPDQLKEHLNALKRGGLFNGFKKTTKDAVNHWKKLARTDKKPSDKMTMVHDLEILRNALLADQELNENRALTDFAGEQLDGIESDFDSFRAAAQYKFTAQSVHGSDTEVSAMLREFMEHTPIDQITRVASVSQSLFTESILDVSELDDTVAINTEIEIIVNSRQLLKIAQDSVDSLNIDNTVTRDQISELHDLCSQWLAANKRLDSLQAVTDKLRGIGVNDSNIELLESTLILFDQFKKIDDSTSCSVSESILAGDINSNLEKLRNSVSQLEQDLFDVNQARLKVLTAASTETIDSTSLPNHSLESIIATSTLANDNSGALARWVQLTSTRMQAQTDRTSETIRIFDQSREPFDLPTVWEHIFWRSRLNEEFRDNSVLRRANGYTQQTARERLKKLDGEITNLTRQQLAAELANKSGPWGNSVGRVRDLTETALIEHLAKQERPQVSVRDFVHRAGNAAVALKPCFMMSPSSVARYLPRGQTMFDIVLMDEASQIKAEEAIGSIARGRQAVIVGDTKQLPPSRFFERLGISQSIDDEDEDIESVLEQALSRFPYRTLRWHYRSEHQDLIKFSNHHFYENRLIVFPSAVDAEALGMGVYFTHLPQAFYQSSSTGLRGGLNPVQADHVAKAAVRSMETRPEWSVGVVAVNKVQAEMIDDQIHVLLQKSPRARKFVNDRENTLEPFFVKNLENVQGDERDHIIISTVYGPTGPGEPTRQGFGPIGGKHGGRRLNVLFSRAKKRIDVISSMTSSDINVTDNSRAGSRALKAYLEFAATGRLGGPNEEVRGIPDNDFEETVGSALALAGYTVHYQVGVAGYKIDLGIRHADYPHGYIAGIECDGATYHSAKSARDRDLLRQQQLERLGWNIFRVWSTDWFVDSEGETKRLIENLNLRVQAAKDEFEKYSESKSHAVVDDEFLEQLDLIEEVTEPSGNAAEVLKFSESQILETDQSVEPGHKSEQRSSAESAAAQPATERIVRHPGDDEHDLSSNIDQSTDWSTLGPALAEYADSIENIENIPEKHHPSAEDEFNLQMMIETVIDVEGPVHSNVIVGRISNVYGMKGLRGSPRDRIQSLISASTREGIVRGSEDFYDLYGQLPWGKDRIPRVAGDRSIEHIDETELLAACHLVSASQKITDPKELLKAVTNALGFRKIGGTIRSRLGNIVSNCIEMMSAESEKTSLQNDPSPNVVENSLVTRGYDPRLDPASRWMFLLNYVIPDLTRDGAINSLNSLIEYMENKSDTSAAMKQAMQEDLSQLQRFRGQR